MDEWRGRWISVQRRCAKGSAEFLGVNGCPKLYLPAAGQPVKVRFTEVRAMSAPRKEVLVLRRFDASDEASSAVPSKLLQAIVGSTLRRSQA